MAIAGTITVNPVRSGPEDGEITGYNITVPDLTKGALTYQITGLAQMELMYAQQAIYAAIVAKGGSPGVFDHKNPTVTITYPDPFQRP